MVVGRRWTVEITAFRKVEGKVRVFENGEKLSWFVFRRFWVNSILGLIMGTAIFRVKIRKKRSINAMLIIKD